MYNVQYNTDDQNIVWNVFFRALRDLKTIGLHSIASTSV